MGVGIHELVIHDGNWREHVEPVVNGERMKRGLIPRDYKKHPTGYYAREVKFDDLGIPLIPRSEWSARIKEMEETKSRLSDLRRTSGPNGGHMPSLDQNGQGFCWAYSGAMCGMLLRVLQGQPYVRFSAHMVACLIKGYRDEGGWGAHGLEFMTEHGIPSVEHWTEKSMSRSNDTPAMRANAKLHRFTEGWADLGASVYNRNLSEEQAMTLLLCRIPLIGDFNWWGHSVCLMDPVEVESGSFGKRGINSWTDSYGDLGEFVLQGGKAILDGGAGPRVVKASQA